MRPRQLAASALISIGLFSAIRAAADEPPLEITGPTVQLPAFQVSDFSLFFGFNLAAHVAKETGLILSLRFTVDHGSVAEKAGLRTRDYLVAVDGKPTTGITVGDFFADWARYGHPGETISRSLTVERGLFRKRSIVVLKNKLPTLERSTKPGAEGRGGE